MLNQLGKVFLALAVATLMVSGCSQIQKTTGAATKPFQSTQQLDLEPFAEQLFVMVGDIQFGLNRTRVTHLIPYTSSTEVEDYRQTWEVMQENLDKILAYSGRVVSLSESRINGNEKAADLSRFIDQIRPLESAQLDVTFGMSEQDIRQLILAIRYQESLLDALRVAQPLVDTTVKYMVESIDKLKVVKDGAEAKIDANINDSHSVPLAYPKTLLERQTAVIYQLQLLDRYRKGDSSSLKQMARADAELKTFIHAGKASTFQGQKELEKLLTHRLTVVDGQKKLLQKALEQYHAEKRELGELSEISDQNLYKAKLAVLLWGQVHRRMANGITEPGKLNLFNLLNKTVDKL
jgi:hypothetical protein